MHTDEYEISISREIAICKRVIREIREKLQQREERFGTTLSGIRQRQKSIAVDEGEIRAWQEDFEALPQWEQRLEEYRQVLAAMRISASHI